MLNNKKSMTEIISFILITLLIVIASSITFLISQDIIDEKVAKIDFNNMQVLFKNLNYKFDEIRNFDGNSFSVPINFRTGTLMFENDELIYYSKESLITGSYCENSVCINNTNDFQKITLFLSDSYQFNKDFKLTPNSYLLFFKNNQNGSEIEIQIK